MISEKAGIVSKIYTDNESQGNFGCCRTVQELLPKRLRQGTSESLSPWLGPLQDHGISWAYYPRERLRSFSAAQQEMNGVAEGLARSWTGILPRPQIAHFLFAK